MNTRETPFQKIFARRIRNQIGSFLTSFTMITLISSGVVTGALAGLALGRKFDQGSGLVIIATTAIGFLLGMVASSAFSPRVLRLSFRATPVVRPATLAMMRELQTHLPQRFDFTLWAVDQEMVTGFGHNVVVTGLPRGQGFFAPAIFASRSVLDRCSEDELYAILAHELSHLQQRHLVKRVSGGALQAFGGSLAVSAMLVGLQLMGFKTVAVTFALFAPLVPVSLIWLNLQRLVEVQEKEADWLAIRNFQARPLDLLNALKKLTLWNQSPVHPLVRERMLILQGLWLTEPQLAEARAYKVA